MTKTDIIRSGLGDTGTVSLSSLDIYEGIYAIGFAFFFRETLDSETLKISLAKTLENYPLLTGRLMSEKGKGQHVHCSDRGLPFTTAHCSVPMEDFGPRNHGKGLASFFIDNVNPWKVKNSDRPLATVKLTHMAGGGSVLGVSILHAIADGESYFHFIDSWAHTHRGLRCEKPCHDRMLLELDISLDRNPRPGHGFRLLSRTRLLASAVNFLRHRGSITSLILHFSRDELDRMKEAASTKADGARQRISTNDALCAHLWQVLSSLENRDGQQRRLLFVANIRRKHEPPLPKHFFGNASLHMILDMAHRDLINAPLSRVAALSREQVNAIDQKTIEGQMSWLRQRFREGSLYRVFADYDPFRGDLFISSDAPYKGYGTDFGSGNPFWITIETYPVPWSLLFMPASDGGDGIDIHAHLPAPAMKKLLTPPMQETLHKYRRSYSKP